ncbi:MAG: hypothetical protein SOZ70_07085 [Bacilli bacterium]|nr:hypothetical protein [Bacilli bacterium]
MKKRNLLVLAGALLIGSGALVGCGGGKTPASEEKKKVDLKVWCANEDAEFMAATIEKFKAANPGTEYNFTVEPVSEGDALTAVQKDLALTADVFHFAGDQLVTLQKNAALYQIPSSFVEGLGLSAGCLGAGQIDGKQYGIPFTPNTYFMYYDSSVYTAEDVKSVTNMLKVDVAKKKAGYKYNAAFDMGNAWYYQSIVYSSGGTMNAETGKFENAETAAKFVAKWNQNEKLIMAGGTANLGTDAAAVVDGAWDAAKFEEILGENYACAPLPTLNFGAGEVAWKAVGDYKMIGVKSTTKVPQHAAKFAAFLSSAEIQTDRFVARKAAPTNELALENDALKENKAIIAQTKTLANTFAQPSAVYSKNDYWNAWKAYWTDLQAADSDEKAVTALNAFNKVLGENFEANKAEAK